MKKLYLILLSTLFCFLSNAEAQVSYQCCQMTVTKTENHCFNRKLISEEHHGDFPPRIAKTCATTGFYRLLHNKAVYSVTHKKFFTFDLERLKKVSCGKKFNEREAFAVVSWASIKLQCGDFYTDEDQATYDISHLSEDDTPRRFYGYFEDLEHYLNYRKSPNQKSLNPFHKIKKMLIKYNITRAYKLSDDDWKWIRHNITDPALKGEWGIRLGKIKQTYAKKMTPVDLLKAMKVSEVDFDKVIEFPKKYADVLERDPEDFTLKEVLVLNDIPSIKGYKQLLTLPGWQETPLENLPTEQIKDFSYEIATWFHPPLTPQELKEFDKFIEYPPHHKHFFMFNDDDVIFPKSYPQISFADFKRFPSAETWMSYAYLKEQPLWADLTIDDFLKISEYDREKMLKLAMLRARPFRYQNNQGPWDEYRTILNQTRGLIQNYPQISDVGKKEYHRNYFELYHHLSLFTDSKEGFRPLDHPFDGGTAIKAFWSEKENPALAPLLENWRKELLSNVKQLAKAFPLLSDKKNLKQFLRLAPLIYENDEKGELVLKSSLASLPEKITAEPSFWIDYLWNNRLGSILQNLQHLPNLKDVVNTPTFQQTLDALEREDKKKQQTLQSMQIKQLSLEKLDPLTAISKGWCASDCSLWTTPFLSLHPDVEVFLIKKGNKVVGYSVVLQTHYAGVDRPYVLAMSPQKDHLSPEEGSLILQMVMSHYQTHELFIVDTSLDHSASMSNDANMMKFWDELSAHPDNKNALIKLPPHWKSITSANKLAKQKAYPNYYDEDSKFQNVKLVGRDTLIKKGPPILSLAKFNAEKPSWLGQEVGPLPESMEERLKLRSQLAKDLDDNDYLHFQVASLLKVPVQENLKDPFPHMKSLLESLNKKRPCPRECREDLISLFSLSPDQLPLEGLTDKEKLHLLEHFLSLPFRKEELPSANADSDEKDKTSFENIKVNLKKLQTGLKETDAIAGSQFKKRKLSPLYFQSMLLPWKNFLQKYGESYKDWGDVFWPSLFTLLKQDQFEMTDEEREKYFALVPDDKKGILQLAQSQKSRSDLKSAIDLGNPLHPKRMQKGNSCFAETAAHLLDALRLEELAEKNLSTEKFQPLSAVYLSFLEKIAKRERAKEGAKTHKGGLFEGGRVNLMIPLINKYGLCLSENKKEQDRDKGKEKFDEDRIQLMKETLETFDLLLNPPLDPLQDKQIACDSLGIHIKPFVFQLWPKDQFPQNLPQNIQQDMIPQLSQKVIDHICPGNMKIHLASPLHHQSYHESGGRLLKRLHEYLDHPQKRKMAIGFCGQLLIEGRGFRPVDLKDENCYYHSAAIEGRKLSSHGEMMVGLVSTWGENSKKLISDDWDFDEEKNIIWIPERELVTNLAFIDEISLQ